MICALVPVSDSRAAGKLVAALLTCDLPRYREAHKAFVKALVLKGYDQSNVEVITQTPNPDLISWSNSVRKFNAIGADVIVAYGTSAALAALRESHDIPIVYADVYGPVETGVAKFRFCTPSPSRIMVFMPTILPVLWLSRGPPLLPWEIGAEC